MITTMKVKPLAMTETMKVKPLTMITTMKRRTLTMTETMKKVKTMRIINTTKTKPMTTPAATKTLPTTPTIPLPATAIACNVCAPSSRQPRLPPFFSHRPRSDSSPAGFPKISPTRFSTSRNALLLSSRIRSLANRILAAVAVDRFLFLQLAGRTVAAEIPQISDPGFPAVPVTIRDFEPSLRKVREFHLPTVSSRFTAEENATDSLRRLAMKLPGYMRHVTERPAGNPYEEVISDIIAGKQSIEALRSLVRIDWRLHRRAFHFPAIPREDSDETPLPPGPHGCRNSGNFLLLCVSSGSFI